MAAGVLKGERLEKELARLKAMTQYEREYEAYAYVCGIDETGRRPLASLVTTGAVILPKDYRTLYLNDPKKLSEKRRGELFEETREKAAVWSVEIAPTARIDEISILQATCETMRDAMGQLGVTPDVLLNDAITIPGFPMKQVPIIKGDVKSFSIAATSVLAKIIRDHMTAGYEKVSLGYGFVKHKDYGTAAHIRTTRELGPCSIHRRPFIRNLMEQEDG